MRPAMTRTAVLLLTFTLAGCGKPATTQQDLDSLDRELANTAPAGDPAKNSSLADRIRVDPASLRRAPAAAAGRRPAQADCVAKVAYSAIWASKLPAAVPLYPDARMVEAAGTDRDDCALRVVNFTSTAPVTRVIDWYAARVTKFGYSAERKLDGAQHILAGTRGDAAYILYIRPRAGGGSDIDLVANAGI